MKVEDEPQSWQELTLHGMLERTTQRWPDGLALVDGNQRLTYASLWRRVQRLARGLLAAGIGPGDHVATLFGPRLEWVCLQYALSTIGAIVAPLNTRLQAAELRQALASMDCVALVTCDREGTHDLLRVVFEACPEMQFATDGAVRGEGLPRLRLGIRFSPDGEAPGPFLPFNRLESQLAEEIPADFQARIGTFFPNAAAVILQTSGSTSAPKAVMLSHSNLIGHAHFLSRFLGIGPGERYLNALPFFHVAGLAQSVVMNHYAGSALFLPQRFTSDEIVETIVQQRITAWAAMPVTTQRVLDYAESAGYRLETVRVQHGVSPELWDRVAGFMPRALLTRMYGLTESAGLVTMTSPDETDPARRRESVGTPLPGVEVRICDPDAGHELPLGRMGEITFRGWNVFRRYYGDPKLTAQTVDPHGYCHSGDYGYIDEDGRLFLVGRRKEIVKTGGENVSQAEVEQILRKYVPGARAVCVIGVPDPVWGEAVTAVVEPDPLATLDLDVVQRCCRSHMASFKLPRHVLLMTPAGWPLTPSGKMDKKALQTWAMKQLGISAG